MYRLFVHSDAEADLESLWDEEPNAAARLTVLLDEIAGDQDLMDRLTQHGFGQSSHASDFHVSKWFEQWRKGRDIWRLKDWDLEAKGLQYRVVYAFVPSKHYYHVLAIAPRDFNYAAAHPLTERILRAYENIR